MNLIYTGVFWGFFSFFLHRNIKTVWGRRREFEIIFRYIVVLMDYPATITAHVNITCVHSMYVDKCTSEATVLHIVLEKKNNETCWNSLPNKLYSWIECDELFLNYICKLNGVVMLLHAWLHLNRNMMGHLILMDTILPQIDFLCPAWQCTSFNDNNGIIIVTAC